jgi:hypothetical protein
MGYFYTRACEYSLEVDGWPLSAISPCWDYTIIPFNNADRPVNGGEDGMDFSNRADKQFSLSIIPTTIQVVRYSMSIRPYTAISFHLAQNSTLMLQLFTHTGSRTYRSC